MLPFSVQDKNKQLLVGGLTCGAAALYLGYRYYKLSSSSVSWPYPDLTETDHTDSYFGTEVTDPYVWLEDPDSEATKDFVERETVVTNQVFEQEGLVHFQKELKAEFEKLYFYDKYSTPTRYGEYIFYQKKAASDNQYILYKQKLSSTGENIEAEILIDPLQLRADGTASLDGYWFTPDGRKMVYAIGYSGSDWKELHVKDVESGEDFERDVIPWCKFTSVAWLPSGKGFFYCCYPSQEEEKGEEEEEKGEEEEEDDKKGTETTKTANHQVKFHSLGTDPSHDMLVLEDQENPNFLFGVGMTHNSDIMLISVSKDCNPQTKLFMVDISPVTHALLESEEEVKKAVENVMQHQLYKLYDHFENDYHYLTHRYDSSGSSGPQLSFWFKTTKEAPRGKVIKVTLSNYRLACFRQKSHLVWSEEEKESLIGSLAETVIIDQHDQDTLEDVDVTSNGIMVLNYLHQVKSLLLTCDLEGSCLSPLMLPNTRHEDGSLKPLSIFCRSNPRNEDFFVSISGFDEPGRVLRGSCQKVRSQETNKDEIQANFDLFRTVDFSSVSVPDTIAASQVFYTSKDGKTQVPMFILEPKDQFSSGNRTRRPCILYGYGGFNISITPYFHLRALTWILKCGGVFCIANIRGGGEFGEEWHEAGTKLQKQNVFDDFISAGEYLIQEGYTSSSMLAIEGGSNGGLLVGACVNQRPDLFRAALAHVGVMDMLKFHKFTIGHFWCSDYGNAEENEEDFHNLLKISPYHSIPSPPCFLRSLLNPFLNLFLSSPRKEVTSFPATLLLTADHDDRVVPLHSFKYISMLQKRWGHHWSQQDPLVIRIEQKAGHGGGKPTTKIVEEVADVLAFAAFYCGAKLVE